MNEEEAAAAIAVEVHQPKYLTREETEVRALVRVLAPGAVPAGAGGRAEVFIVDCSASMAHPLARLHTARRAVTDALGGLPDGARFAVLKGQDAGSMAYPNGPELARADQRTRSEAQDAVARLDAAGGARVGGWLRLARGLLDPHPGLARHVTLVSGGDNDDDPAGVSGVASGYQDTFTCDIWPVDEKGALQAEVTRTRALDASAVGEASVDITVRIEPGAEFTGLREISPADTDRTRDCASAAAGEYRYRTEALAAEIRDYLLILTVPRGRFPQDEDVTLARVDAAAGDGGTDDDGTGHGEILAHWMPVPPTRTESGRDDDLRDAKKALDAGCRHWLAGQPGEAEKAWTAAVTLATAAGDDTRLTLLRSLVEIDDQTGQAVRLRDQLLPEDVKEAQDRSSYADFAPSAATESDPWRAGHHPAGPPALCPEPECGWRSPPGARFCEKCRHDFRQEADRA